MSDQEVARGITWDLTDLYAGPDDPRIRQDLEGARATAGALAKRARGRIHVADGPAAAVVVDAVATMEAILEQAGKTATYAELIHAADATPPAHGALVAFTQEETSAIRQELLFVELEWLALEDAAAQRVIDDPLCRRYRAIGISALDAHTLRPLLSEIEAQLPSLMANYRVSSGLEHSDETTVLASHP